MKDLQHADNVVFCDERRRVKSDEVLASDGKTNLRSENKLRALTERFGARGFDYAGNSSADYAVWRGARQAIVVNARKSVAARAATCTTA